MEQKKDFEMKEIEFQDDEGEEKEDDKGLSEEMSKMSLIQQYGLPVRLKWELTAKSILLFSKKTFLFFVKFIN